MCILIAMKGGATVPREHLTESVASNPNGAGWAIHVGDGVIWARSLDGLGVVESFLAARNAYPDGPALFHARIASRGDVCLDNTQPFVVGNCDDTVVAHNGVCLPIAGDVDWPKHHSDTRVFAERWLPELGLGELDVIDKTEWERWLNGNKVVVLSANPLLKQPLYIFGESKGHWVNDVWYSNHGYQPVRQWSGYVVTWTKDKEGHIVTHDNRFPPTRREIYADIFAGETCYQCGSWLLETDYLIGKCAICNLCLVCEDKRCTCVPEERAAALSTAHDIVRHANDQSYELLAGDPVTSSALLDPFTQTEEYNRAIAQLLAEY